MRNKELIAAIAAKLKSFGFTVYLSKTAEYGFYTDGLRVVCFGLSYGAVNFSGNYKSKNSGSGWRMDGGEMLVDIDQRTAEMFVKAHAPHWAVKGESVAYTTPEQHLKTYGSSSGYSEI